MIPSVIFVKSLGVDVRGLAFQLVLLEVVLRSLKELVNVRHGKSVRTQGVAHGRVLARAADSDHGLMVLMEHQRPCPGAITSHRSGAGMPLRLITSSAALPGCSEHAHPALCIYRTTLFAARMFHVVPGHTQLNRHSDVPVAPPHSWPTLQAPGLQVETACSLIAPIRSTPAPPQEPSSAATLLSLGLAWAPARTTRHEQERARPEPL